MDRICSLDFHSVAVRASSCWETERAGNGDRSEHLVLDMKMKWSNLSKNKCPQCNKGELGGLRPGMIGCKEGCGFQISERRMSEIISDQNSQRLQDTGEPEIYEGPEK